ncbi:2-hydroxyacid dehydrogenase [Mucilaginibacter arboris]|uniref:2-hydroxyacid dehydrogenase n=1 Tax=Mucilaginibacter arboris TaxID=2682090 RepID=A0A7K1SWD5_9SPHI|nr:2-hydroxyacid dehydrogenase [Mucilaginibacter arboris]MVN21614.1 2-hydroxyacid dehydrogenase [Mucilaginibacter arboris]
MKAVAYSIRSFEKEPLALANQKKHDLTLISNTLNLQTAFYAEGKDAVLVFTNDDVSAPVIEKLAGFGVKYIVTRSTGTDQIDLNAAASFGIKVANIPSYSPFAIAEQSVALAMALNRKLVETVNQSRNFDFRIDQHIGFNFYGKTVGIIGLGTIGRATAAIYNGLGCTVLGFDVANQALTGIEQVNLEALFKHSDVISLHLPLTPQTKYLVNKETIALMKKGVMLINTARGALINTTDVLGALKNGYIGYLGIDVFEDEKGIFFEDHHADSNRNPLLEELMTLSNVMITPHQGFLTQEALQEIAIKTIAHLNIWQQKKCLGMLAI